METINTQLIHILPPQLVCPAYKSFTFLVQIAIYYVVSVQCETLLVKYMLLTFIILDSKKVSHISIPRVNVVESNVKVKNTHHKF